MFWKKREGGQKSKPEYRGHLKQDFWVSNVYRHQTGGYFLDFGAFDGLDLSNTFYLEKGLDWKGICVEPNPTYYPTLCAERSAICVNLALWPKSRERLSLVDAHGLSSFDHLKDSDSNSKNRNDIARRVIEVDTINPTELLDRFQAPSFIEYMSLDVEGAEYDILTGIDFSRYDIGLMTVEHDENEERQRRVREYLAQFGYVGISIGYDDFFYRESGTYPRSPKDVAAGIRLT